jgi:hypothetical protein
MTYGSISLSALFKISDEDSWAREMGYFFCQSYSPTMFEVHFLFMRDWLYKVSVKNATITYFFTCVLKKNLFNRHRLQLAFILLIFWFGTDCTCDFLCNIFFHSAPIVFLLHHDNFSYQILLLMILFLVIIGPLVLTNTPKLILCPGEGWWRPVHTV